MIKFLIGMALGAGLTWGVIHEVEVRRGVDKAQKVGEAVQGALKDTK